MKPGQSTVLEWYLVVEANQFHQHIANENHKISDITIFILHRHGLDQGSCRASPFRGGSLV